MRPPPLQWRPSFGSTRTATRQGGIVALSPDIHTSAPRLLSELSGFCLAVDCLTADCGGERTFAMSDLAGFYGTSRTVGDVLRRMRCSGGCGGRAGAAWLVTGPVLSSRVRPRRVPLLGVEVRE
jgi:hypothetical protein